MVEVERATVETECGPFTAVVFQNRLTGRTHLALARGDLDGDGPVLVRVHRQSVPGDVFRCRHNPSGAFLHRCLRHIAESGRGVVLYLRPENGGVRLLDEVRACRQAAGQPEYSFPDERLAREDPREIGIGAQILRALGLRRIVLLTEHPRPFGTLQAYGLTIEAQQTVPV